MKKQHHLDLLPGDVSETVILSPDIENTGRIAEFLHDARLIAKKRQYVTYNGSWNDVPVVSLPWVAAGAGNCGETSWLVLKLILVGSAACSNLAACAISDYTRAAQMVPVVNTFHLNILL